MARPRVAVFRPADDRLAEAIAILESFGADPVGDPMLAVEATGSSPRADADYVVLTSRTGVELLPADWTPGEASIVAIGPKTADALRSAGYVVDLMPETYSSAGLVAALEGHVDGARVEVARSDHGSATLLDGLERAGAYHHETVLYQLVRPEHAGESVRLAAEGELDAALFTSSLTVEHFVEIAAEQAIAEVAINGLNRAIVGAIGTPTRETAEARGIEVDVVPSAATFKALASAVMDQL